MESNPPGARKLGGHQQEKVMVVFGTSVEVIFSQRGPKPANGKESRQNPKRVRREMPVVNICRMTNCRYYGLGNCFCST